MERVRSYKEREEKGLILKTLERCRSLGNRKTPRAPVPKTNSWPRVTPKGCVTVYVGPDKERFVVRTECVSHPLFKALLDEAEREYGYAREGPIELPCAVDDFDRVLWEMAEEEEEFAGRSPGWCSLPASPARGFGKGHAGYRILIPSRLVIAGRMIYGVMMVFLSSHIYMK